MTTQYLALRSVSNNHVHLICRDGEFDSLPDEVRKQGPWQVLMRGEVDRLKLTYRAALARQGYVLVDTPLAMFQPEA